MNEPLTGEIRDRRGRDTGRRGFSFLDGGGGEGGGGEFGGMEVGEVGKFGTMTSA